MIFYYKNVSFADFTHKKIYVRICVNVCKVNICEYMCMNFTNVLFLTPLLNALGEVNICCQYRRKTQQSSKKSYKHLKTRRKRKSAF